MGVSGWYLWSSRGLGPDDGGLASVGRGVPCGRVFRVPARGGRPRRCVDVAPSPLFIYILGFCDVAKALLLAKAFGR